MQIAIDKLREIAQQLATTSRGRSAMTHVLAWLDDDGLGLDLRNQRLITQLLNAAWDGNAMSARDVMREALNHD